LSFLLATTAGFLFASDSAVTAFENRELGYTDEDMLHQLRQNTIPDQNMSSFDRSIHYLNDNRWSFIGKFLLKV
jgi:hypothetical protein